MDTYDVGGEGESVQAAPGGQDDDTRGVRGGGDRASAFFPASTEAVECQGSTGYHN